MIMVLSVMPFSALNIVAEGTHTVTLYANDGLGTQTQVSVADGLYVLPECDFPALRHYFGCHCVSYSPCRHLDGSTAIQS